MNLCQDNQAMLRIANQVLDGEQQSITGKQTDTSLLAVAERVLGKYLVNTDKVSELALWQEKTLDIDDKMTASREMESLLHGFRGGYISAGPSGLISRGRVDIMPTGRNFYSADPERIPTQAAWRVGQKLAAALLDRNQQDTGKLPENCAMILNAGDSMWTDGEQVAQILTLIGVEPKWLPGGKVKGFKIIPLSELQRPRIDVTLKISGILRDCFPGITEMLDQAIRAVAALDEPVELNYVRKHTLENLEVNQNDWDMATARIFGSRPGTYGSGVNLAVYASAWNTEKDLADIYLHWSGYAYGKDRGGQEAQPQLENQLKTVDVTYYGDTRDPERAQVTSLAEEINRVVRIKILNPHWIEGMKRHGYKGAGDMAKRIGRIYGWEATTGVVGDWVFNDIAQTYVLDKEMREWFEEQSPWALEEINRRLLEAAQRGLWQADPEILEGIQETYMEIEGWMEERMGDVEGEFQGGSIDILTMEDIPAWKAKMAK